MPTSKIGWTSSDFINEVEKTRKWNTANVVQMPEERFKVVLEGAKTGTDLVRRMKDANIQEFAIGYAFSDVNSQIKEQQKNVAGLMELKQILEQKAQASQASQSEMEKMRRSSAGKKLTYID